RLGARDRLCVCPEEAHQRFRLPACFFLVASENRTDQSYVLLSGARQAALGLIAEPEAAAMRLKRSRKPCRKEVVGCRAERFVKRLVRIEELQHLARFDSAFHRERSFAKTHHKRTGSETCG